MGKKRSQPFSDRIDATNNDESAHGRIAKRLALFITAVFFAWTCWTSSLLILSQSGTRPSFSHLSSHCSTKPPILAAEYSSRLASLASTLSALNATAYIAEPGPNALYYGNISSFQWRLSERPLLLVITSSGEVTVITPQFEVARAKLLNIPAENVTYVTWDEAENPYAATLEAIGSNFREEEEVTIIVDEDARYFIAEGLKGASGHVRVQIAPPEVKALRERKKSSELDLLQCANEVTLLAVREVRKHLYFGMHESEAMDLMIEALRAAGLTDNDALVLFGENAALPHGSGTNRVLTPQDFVLMDVGGSLHGYKSDLTRTFALPESDISASHLAIWYNVQRAQEKALAAVRAGVKAGDVDANARNFLKLMGLGPYFTHRLGHGIGLEGHESPYLLPGNPTLLAAGNVFSDEPGVYIEGDVGVRLEDCFYVTSASGGVPLTAEVGGLAISPWEP